MNPPPHGVYKPVMPFPTPKVSNNNVLPMDATKLDTSTGTSGCHTVYTVFTTDNQSYSWSEVRKRRKDYMVCFAEIAASISQPHSRTSTTSKRMPLGLFKTQYIAIKIIRTEQTTHNACSISYHQGSYQGDTPSGSKSTNSGSTHGTHDSSIMSIIRAVIKATLRAVPTAHIQAPHMVLLIP